MQIDPGIISEMESINWLSMCGLESPMSFEKYLRQVANWSEADAAYDKTWESIKDSLDNEIRIVLSLEHKERFQLWNNFTITAKGIVSQRFAPQLIEIVKKLELNPFYSSAICRDLYMCIMEVTYAKVGCVIPIFYRNLFKIYQAGHFPCGWGGGPFPVGHLLYY